MSIQMVELVPNTLTPWVAGAALGFVAVAAGVLNDEVAAHVRKVDPCAGREVQYVLAGGEGMAHGDGDGVIVGTRAARSFVQDRVAWMVAEPAGVLSYQV